MFKLTDDSGGERQLIALNYVAIAMVFLITILLTFCEQILFLPPELLLLFQLAEVEM